MNKNKKKGFTLVELLAVIVILAVVILIAVTAVVPRMNNAKKKAFLDETLVYMKAAKEAYVADPSTECYNISDMGSLVKQSKAGYSGTVYVNEKEVSINITNGKYYIKTNTTPIELDMVETMPDKYVSTCSEVKEYDIEYDLPSDATVSGNPSKYKTNDATITLNNPTRPGYKFVGWSSKNILNINAWMNVTYYVHNGKIERHDKKIVLESSGIDCYTQPYGTDSSSFKIPVKLDTDYTLSWKPTPATVPGRVFIYVPTIGFTNLNNSVGTNFSFHTSQTTNNVNLRFGVQEANNTVMYSNVQIEEGTVATDYQEYMEPTTSAKIYRGSTGNKKFISNWEPL